VKFKDNGEENMNFVRNLGAARAAVLAVIVGVCLTSTPGFAQSSHASSKFAGPKANTGFVTHSKDGDKNVLTLSDDFQVPDTPDPHWQIVDSNGTVYQLDKLKVKSLIGDKVKKQIVVPSYIPNVAKVQIYCAWAEAVLSEASFSSPVR
jgi:hypothetical protein